MPFPRPKPAFQKASFQDVSGVAEHGYTRGTAVRRQGCVRPRSSHRSHPHCPENSPPKESTRAQDVSHASASPTYGLMRDPSISENALSVPAAQAAPPPLLLCRGYRKCHPPPSSSGVLPHGPPVLFKRTHTEELAQQSRIIIPFRKAFSRQTG